LRIATRGDWQTRAFAFSAAGRLAGTETPIGRGVRWMARRVPGWRTKFPSAAYARDFIQNGLADRSWPVRTAAALALGECPRHASRAALRRQLRGPYRPERIAAAAALVRCGESIEPVTRAALLEGALSAPERIGDATSSAEFLQQLAERHARVLEAWPQNGTPSQPDGPTPASWARFLAGPPFAPRYGGHQAEIDRYDPDSEAAYLAAKPFSPINRAQNLRLLHTFVVAAEHLDAPIGARVLDLGSGSGWVSELLSKLGFETYTLDIAFGLLKVGQARFDRERLKPRFMAGDMARLPIASGSMAAVIVSDALHHVPDVPAVFREAFRTLEEGGQFVLSEPGEGHAETAKSRGEMLQYGVAEREIHLFEAIEYARAAGFDDVRVVPALAPELHIRPDEIGHAMRTSADEWFMRQYDGQAIAFAPFVLQSLFDHPVIVCRKGVKIPDSRSPRRLGAEIAHRLERRGRRIVGTVTLRNTGDTRWLPGREATGAVLFGIHLLSTDRGLLHFDLFRAPLPGPVEAASSTRLSIDFELPDETTAFCLKLDLVAEGICWFEDAGVEPVHVAV
jgi:ubiquinone/menaquinone biosynthesis C-methylase UbiE